MSRRIAAKHRSPHQRDSHHSLTHQGRYSHSRRKPTYFHDTPRNYVKPIDPSRRSTLDHTIHRTHIIVGLIVAIAACVLTVRACKGTSQEDQSQTPSTETQQEVTTTAAELQQQYSTDIRDTLFSLSGTPCDSSFWSSVAYGRLTQAIGSVEDDGAYLGIALIDINSGTTITYNQDMEAYPASSIKGPYVTSLYKQLVESGSLGVDDLYNLSYDIIINSDNIAYTNARETYGNDAFEEWLEGAGVSAGAYDDIETYSSIYYPTTSPRQLVTMWLYTYDYIMQDTAAGGILSGIYANRETSAIKDALEDSYLTWSKAGWYPSYDGSYSAPATVDAGIVWSDSGPYVVTVMSTIASDMDELTPIFAVLDEAHDQLVSQDSDLAETLGTFKGNPSKQTEFQLETGLF